MLKNISKKFSVVLLLLVGADIAPAAETTIYRYDALGRLATVCNAASSFLSSRGTFYTLDKAGNRTNYWSQEFVFALTNGSVWSQNGLYEFKMQTDGNLVLYGPTGPRWASNTNGSAGRTVLFQGDGNMVIYTPAGVPIWASNTNGYPCARLQVQNDGNVVIVSADNQPIWATNTASP